MAPDGMSVPMAALERPDAAFADHLEQVLAGTSLAPSEVLAMAEERCRFSYVALSAAVASDAVDLEEILARLAGRKVDRLCILPVPTWAEANVERFASACDEVVLCDNKKAGTELAGVPVISQGQLRTTPLDADAYLIATSAGDIAALFAEVVPSDRTVSFARFAEAVTGGASDHETAGEERRVDKLLLHIRAAERPLVVLAGIYLNGYTPTLEALVAEGFDVFVVARTTTAFVHLGHQTDLHELAGFTETHTVSHAGMLRLLAGIDRGVVFIPGAEETFIGCSFDARRAAAAYAYVAALAHTAHVPVVVGLYDVVKPVTKTLEYEEDGILTYGHMFRAATAVTLGANTADAGALVSRALSVATPVTSFYRYPHRPQHSRERRAEGIHLVMVGGGLCGESANPFWLSHEDYRRVLAQGIHLHVYSSASTPQRFRDALPPDSAPFFHVHPSIADQQELLAELSAYHAGFIVNDTTTLIDMMAAQRTRFMRELTHVFLQSMASSAAMLFGAAGIPIFLNRTCAGILHEFPREYFLPIELSELPHLGDLGREIDWDHRHAVTRANRDRFTIEANISRFVEILDRPPAPAFP